MAVVPEKKKSAMDATIGKLKAKAREWKYETPKEKKIALAQACLDRLATLRKGGDKWIRAGSAVEGLVEEDMAGEKRLSIVISLAPVFKGIIRSLSNKHVPKVSWETKTVRVYETGALDNSYTMLKELWTDPAVKTVWGFDDENDDKEKKGRVCLVLGAGNVDAVEIRDAVDRVFLHGDVVLLKHHSIRWFLYDFVEYVLGPLVDAGVLCHVPDEGQEYAKALVEHPDIGHVHLTGGVATHNAVRRELDAAGKKDVVLSSELGCATPWIVFANPPRAPPTEEETKPGHRRPAPQKEWNMESLWFYARQIAAAKTNNGGALCLAPQVLILPSSWEYKETFLRLLREAFEKHKARPSYYPNSLERVASIVDGIKDTAKSVESVRPNEFATPQETLDKLNKQTSEAGRTTHAKYYDVTVIHVGQVPKERKEWAAWSARYKSLLQEEAFGPLLAVVEMPSPTPSHNDLEKDKEAYKQSLRETMDFTNNHLFGSLTTTLLVPESVETDFLNECLEKLQYGAVGINIWSALVYTATEGGWGAYPGLYKPDDVGSGNYQVGNPYKIPGLCKTVLRGPFHDPLTDVAAPIAPIVVDALIQFTCRRDYGFLVAILAALWSILTFPFRPILAPAE